MKKETKVYRVQQAGVIKSVKVYKEQFDAHCNIEYLERMMFGWLTNGMFKAQ
jgi:hypothetical protein